MAPKRSKKSKAGPTAEVAAETAAPPADASPAEEAAAEEPAAEEAAPAEEDAPEWFHKAPEKCYACGASVPLSESIEGHLLGCLAGGGDKKGKDRGVEAQLYLVQDPRQVYTLWFAAQPHATFADLDRELRRLWMGDVANEHAGSQFSLLVDPQPSAIPEPIATLDFRSILAGNIPEPTYTISAEPPEDEEGEGLSEGGEGEDGDEEMDEGEEGEPEAEGGQEGAGAEANGGMVKGEGHQEEGGQEEGGSGSEGEEGEGEGDDALMAGEWFDSKQERLSDRLNKDLLIATYIFDPMGMTKAYCVTGPKIRMDAALAKRLFAGGVALALVARNEMHEIPCVNCKAPARYVRATDGGFDDTDPTTDFWCTKGACAARMKGPLKAGKAEVRRLWNTPRSGAGDYDGPDGFLDDAWWAAAAKPAKAAKGAAGKPEREAKPGAKGAPSGGKRSSRAAAAPATGDGEKGKKAASEKEDGGGEKGKKAAGKVGKLGPKGGGVKKKKAGRVKK